MRRLGLCLDESEIDLGSPRLAQQGDTLGFTSLRAKGHLAIRHAFSLIAWISKTEFFNYLKYLDGFAVCMN